MAPDSLPTLQPQPTGDGSYTFVSTTFGEAFHSHYGARQEAEHKFVIPTALATAAQRPQLCLLDICYGLGYNSAAALHAIWAVNPQCHVTLYGLELNAAVPQAAIAHGLLNQWPDPIPTALAHLAQQQAVERDRLQAKLCLGDARQQIQTLAIQADAIFLDPFSPPRCPQLWTVEFLALVARRLAPTGSLATYSCSAAVRRALSLAGLALGSTPAVGRRSPGTIARWQPQDLPPLSPQEQEHLHTRASIPYRDPNLTDTTAAILARRAQEQAASSLEPTSRWKARWQSPHSGV
jgi:tRNA U34 5-methylaminomethyl-2-thiouridine-forming methyltransferase MnmC